MKNNIKWLIGSALLLGSISCHAEVIITPYIGFTGGGNVEDEDGAKFDIEPSPNYALAVETPFENGRLGLFYSYQSTELERVNNNSDFHYLHFQSSILYPISQGWSSQLGIGLGAAYTDVDWADTKYGFSATAFLGMEYTISPEFALTAQVRWLGTVVDNDTSGACVLPDDGSNCVIKFETDWMNQFQSNIGFTFRF
ncbi:porin family protein [Vibrio rotiferianus]|uniref:porin family protein n=1 Tax=Vibrio rotiferianus TaxID=190895 RepID=UPI001110F892|nr:porin family protein [Vibrio rotiferianus]TMX66770.1 hypothetical protein DA097_09010 [Vibrio rotiferianus]